MGIGLLPQWWLHQPDTMQDQLCIFLLSNKKGIKSVLQTHAERTGDGEGFLPVYRSNLTHPGSHHIQHSHGIEMKFQSTPEGSVGVCSLLPEERQNSNSAWIDTCCKWRARRTIACSCHSSREEIRAVVSSEQAPTMELCAMGALLPAGSRWKGDKGNGTTRDPQQPPNPRQPPTSTCGCSCPVLRANSTPKSSSAGPLPAHPSPELPAPGPLLA